MSGMSQRTNILEFSSKSQKWVRTAGSATGNFGLIQIFEDGTTFSDLVLPNSNDPTIPEAITYNKGEVLYGTCTSFTLTAGAACGHEF